MFRNTSPALLLAEFAVVHSSPIALTVSSTDEEHKTFMTLVDQDGLTRKSCVRNDLGFEGFYCILMCELNRRNWWSYGIAFPSSRSYIQSAVWTTIDLRRLVLGGFQ
uniref:Uncharacterized protein n=1 Tax=Parascaris univalens TaxID=6257 RepID=A0A914ZIV8_PARUN